MHCLVDDFLGFTLLLLLVVRIHVLHLLVFTDLLKLLLPFSLSLSINLCDIALRPEPYLSQPDEFLGQRLHQVAQFLVGLAALIDVSLDHLCIVVHPHLALIDGLDHVGGLLSDALNDTLQVLHRLHPLVVLVREEVLNVHLFVLLVIFIVGVVKGCQFLRLLWL